MSVVINGMTMPEKCDECACYKEESYYFRWCCIKRTTITRSHVHKHRPDWCPLEECESWITKRRLTDDQR